MAHGGDLFAIGDGVPSEQNFEIAFRGYKQDQVDNFVRLLETDLAPMQARARAWALGDVDTLRRLPHADDRTACVAAVSTSERVRNLIARAQDDWLIAVQDSLARNRGTLAVQSMDRLLGENGALAALGSKGYLVEGP